MAVLGRLLVSSAERLDLPDFLAIDSYTQGDFKYLMKSFVGDEKPFVLKGFDVINPNNAIGTQNISIRVANSVMYYPTSMAGPFFYGLEEGNLQAAPLVPELRKNSTNYVYLVLSTADAAKDTRAFWDPDKNGGDGGEFTQDVNTQTLLSAQVNVSVSSFPDDTVPICKVVVGANFIESIEDARDMMFRLGSGGLVPNPLNRYNFRQDPSSTYARKEPNTKMQSALDPNPFFGGDKNIQTLKEWMDVVMTKFSELGGTTYWYEDVGAFNIVNTFKDALATSVKSKGSWTSSEITAGNLIWTEDVIIQSTSDKRDVIIRAGNRTLADEQVLFLERIREVNINTGALAVDWFNSVNHVNGTIGSFENLAKGDWIKKSDDIDSMYLRVEEFYLGTNQSGGVGSPGTAQSIKLSESYGGTTESKQAVYTKGVYLSSDLQIDNRNSLDINSAAGNFYWIALRSDTIMSVASIVTTNLAVAISGHDGAKALVTSVAHGLTDGQDIAIAGTVNFNGTYKVEVESVNEFIIYKTGGPFADESGTAHFATITTQARSTANGFQLESATHGFDTGETVTISGTTNYNGDVKVFVKNATSFTIAVSSAIATENAGTATATDLYVRTETGPLKLERGESKDVGAPETANLMAFIGMESATQTSPIYRVPTGYNTINGYQNYNSSATDNLSERVSKLTAMMADKAQDKTISFKLTDAQAIVNAQNGAARDISFTAKVGGTPTLEFIQPSTLNSLSIGLTGVLSLLVNQVAYITIDRDSSVSIANLAAITIADIDSVPLNENIFVFALRLADSGIILWDRTPIRVYSTIIEDITVHEELFTLPPASSITSGQAFEINTALDADEMYGWFNKDGAGGDPLIPGKISIEIPISTGDTALIVASSFHAVVNATAGLSSTDNLDGTVTVSRTSAGQTTASSNIDVGGSFAITVVTQGTGSPLNYVADGDLLEAAIKKLDAQLSAISNSGTDEAYDEVVDIIAPVTASTLLNLPLDTRDSNIAKTYVVGSGKLEMFLNGQYLRLGQDWDEVGTIGSDSVQIEILQDLVIGDSLEFRINASNAGGGGGGGGGSGETNTGSNVGAGAGTFKSKVGVDLQFRSIIAGAGVSVTQNANDITITSTPTTANASVVSVSGSNYVATASNDIILVSNAGNNVSVTLPSAIGNSGKILQVKKIDASNTLSVKSVLSQTLDGVNITSGSYDIITQWESVTIVSNGADWFIL